MQGPLAITVIRPPTLVSLMVSPMYTVCGLEQARDSLCRTLPGERTEIFGTKKA